jgi:hypothetical protein
VIGVEVAGQYRFEHWDSGHVEISNMLVDIETEQRETASVLDPLLDRVHLDNEQARTLRDFLNAINLD